MCLSNLFCNNDCTWAWILFIIGILLLLDNNCCDNNRRSGCNDCGCNDCGCGCR